MIRNSFSFQFVIKIDKLDSNGFVPIYARVFINKTKIELSTFQRINPKSWDKTKHLVSVKATNAETVNQFLENFKSKVYTTYSNILAKGLDLNTKIFKEEFFGKTEIVKEKMLIQTATEHNVQFEKLVPKKYSYGSLKNYKTTLKYLQEFVPKCYKTKDIELTQVDYKFCEAYYYFLTHDKPCTNNGANKHIQRVRKIINYAINLGYLHVSKMNTFKLESTPVAKPFLTIEEVNRIASLTITRKTLNNVRYVFLFQCYTGLSYSDVKQINHTHITTINEQKWIKMKRQKTSVSFSVPLLNKAEEILNRYNHNGKGLLFPVLSNHKMNQYLKILQELASIDKTLTTHLARHTFATSITLANGVPIETVSRMLGHTKLSTTQIYAKVLDEKIERDMKVLQKKNLL